MITNDKVIHAMLGSWRPEHRPIDSLRANEAAIDGLYAIWWALAHEVAEQFRGARPSLQPDQPTIYY
jgi:hypothetical protein